MNRAERRRAKKGKEEPTTPGLPESVTFLLPEPMLVGRRVRARLLELHDDNPIKTEFCTVSRRLLSLAYQISDDADCMFLMEILTRIVEGTSVHMSGIGEFLDLYGALEGKLKLPGRNNQREMAERMRTLASEVEGTDDCRTYERDDKTIFEDEPLPLYTRNVLAHSGTNRLNTLTIPDDVDASIEILRKWLAYLDKDDTWRYRPPSKSSEFDRKPVLTECVGNNLAPQALIQEEGETLRRLVCTARTGSLLGSLTRYGRSHQRVLLWSPRLQSAGR